MGTDLRQRERAAWEEFMRRLAFLSHAYQHLDATSMRLAAERMAEALHDHEFLLNKRAKQELGGN